MALPIDGRAIGNILATTLDAQLPEATDNFFKSNPLALRLLQRSRKDGFKTIRYGGGAEIRSAIVYAGVPAYNYDSGFTFGTTKKEFATALQFQWKQAAAEINVDTLDVKKNAGSEAQLIDYVEVLTDNAFNSLYDVFGYRIFGTKPDPATGATVVNATPTIDPITGSPAFDGLYNGVLDTGVYGGITRGAGFGTPGASIIAQANLAVGVPYSNALAMNSWGAATFGNDQPDLIVTTQKIFNQMWARAQAQDRNSPGPLRDVGFRTINFNGAEVVVDQHCLAGNMYFLNTKYIEMWIEETTDFVRRGAAWGPNGFPVFNQDQFVDQLVLYGNLIIPGPRYQAIITGILE